jgi:hypothetical protein
LEIVKVTDDVVAEEAVTVPKVGTRGVTPALP